MKLPRLFSKRLPLVALTVAKDVTNDVAKEAFNVCGPDGPAPATKEAARAFDEANYVTVNRFIPTAGADIMLMREGRATSRAKEFAESLRYPAGARIFANWA